MLHNLSVWTATEKNLSYDQAKDAAKSAKKESKLVRNTLHMYIYTVHVVLVVPWLVCVELFFLSVNSMASVLHTCFSMYISTLSCIESV